MNLQAFIANTGITSKIKRVDSNPNMNDDANWHATASHWLVTLRSGRFSMRVPFSQGSAHTKAPSAADVLDCLASDAAGVENARDFADWCAEYGYDVDSRKAHKTYTICTRQAAKMKAMLGQDNYETLLFKTERM